MRHLWPLLFALGCATRPSDTVAPAPLPTVSASPSPTLVNGKPTLRLADAEYTLVDVEDVDRLVATDGDYKTTEGRFFRAHLRVVNLRGKPETLLRKPTITATHQQFGSIDPEDEWLPVGATALRPENPIPPNTPMDFWTVIEVWPNSKNLELEVYAFDLRAKPGRFPLR